MTIIDGGSTAICNCDRISQESEVIMGKNIALTKINGSPDLCRLAVSVSPDQKIKLQQLADHNAMSISALVGAVADGKMRIMTKREGILLDYIYREMGK